MLPESLTAVTLPLDGDAPLLQLSDPAAPLLWSRRGDGMVGIGEALRLEFRGANRIAQASAAWRELAARTHVTDPLGLPGTGLVAFGTFAFSDRSALPSVLIVPERIVGVRDGQWWLTQIRSGEAVAGSTPPAAPPALPAATAFGTPARASFRTGTQGRDEFVSAVRRAVEHIQAGRLEKTVLARDAVADLPAGSDLRTALDALVTGYPDCWTFAVDGFIGSSPETLIQVSQGSFSARVLAGSMARGEDAASDTEAAVQLATSAKDLDEHQFAVRSVTSALRSHATALSVSELPFTLKLPNLWHLASDVEGTLGDGSSSLDLVQALHPTAAVAGTPRAEALAVIDELEPFDRGRYAGPVGWIDGNGDGEWAVAVRSAQVSPEGLITAYAGCGIVAESEPERELAETSMKFRPIVEAFR